MAETGSYRDLSNNPDGAFSKLMEWQMSGGESDPAVHPRVKLHEVDEELHEEEHPVEEEVAAETDLPEQVGRRK